MFETNAMRFPSGEKLGDEQAPILAIRVTIRLRSSLAAVGTVFCDEVVRLEETRKIAHKNARSCRRLLHTALELIIEWPFSFLASIDEMLFLFGTRHIN